MYLELAIFKICEIKRLRMQFEMKIEKFQLDHTLIFQKKRTWCIY